MPYSYSIIMQNIQDNEKKFDKAHTKQHIYYYCSKIILREKCRNSCIIAYILDENNKIFILIIRSGYQINITKPQCSNAGSKKYYSFYSEYTHYTCDTSNTIFFQTIEYYLICIYVSHSMKTNFSMLSHLYVVKRLEPNVIVERLCMHKFIFIT